MSRSASLGDVTVKIGSGATPRGGANSYLASGPVTLIRSQNVRDDGFDYTGLAYISEEQALKLKNVEVQEGDVLVNITGDSVARVGRVPAKILPARVNQHVAIIRAEKGELDSDFLYYFLIESRMKNYLLTLASTGATRNALTKMQLEKLSLDLPDIKTQRKIAGILKTIDEKIELNRRMNETLEQMGQALFKHYFITNPEAEKWQLDTVDSLFNLTMGLSPKGESYNGSGDGVPLLNGAADFTGTSITPKRHTSAPTRISHPGDIILCIRGTIGNVCIGYEKYCLGRGVAAMTPKQNCTGYVYYSTIQAVAEMESAASGSVIRGLSKDDIAKRKVKLPPLDILSEFEASALPLIEKVRVNSEEIQVLTTLRDALLPRLISGKVKV